MSGRGQVHDGQTAMPQAEAAVGVKALAVRAAMGQGVGHAPQQDRRHRFAIEIKDAGYAAHNR